MDKLQCMINLFSADIAISDLRLLIYSKQIMERSKYDLIVGQWIRQCHPNPWPFQDYYQITQNLICDIWYICNYIIIWLFDVWLFRYFFIRWCEKPKCMTLSPHPWTIFFCVPWSFLCLFLKSQSLWRSLEEAVRVVRTVHQVGEAVGGARQAGSKIGRTYQFHLESLSNQGPKGESQARQVGLIGGLLWSKMKSGLASSATRSGRTWLMLWVWNMSVLAGQRGSGFACAHFPSKGINTGRNCRIRNSSRSGSMKLFLRLSTWRQAIDEFICNFLILHMYSIILMFFIFPWSAGVLMYYVFMYVLFIYLMYFVFLYCPR